METEAQQEVNQDCMSDLSEDEDGHQSGESSPTTSTADNSSTSDEVDYLQTLAVKEKLDSAKALKERNYQSALLQMVIDRNAIICLPTGSGKTFIAVQLARKYLHDESKSNQIIVFLACSVPLVHQQSKYLRDNLSPSFSKSDELVMELTGDLDIDKYSKDSNQLPVWKSWMKKHRIFVMTAQIFCDCLGSSNIKWSNVSLAIFDECHNAVGDHPMAKIMKHYGERKKQGYQPLPRILGLTATIINGGTKKTGAEDIAENIRNIQILFDAKAVTYHDYEDVLKHSTNAKTKHIYFNNDSLSDNWNVKELVTGLECVKEYLNSLDRAQFDDRQTKMKDVEHISLNSLGQVFPSNAKTIPQKLCSILTDVTKILKDLGPYCARLACHMKRAFLLIAMEIEDDEMAKSLFQLVDTALFSCLYGLDKIICTEKEDSQVLVFITDKLSQLCQLLEMSRETLVEPLCGLVFAEQRLTVQVLTWYLQDRARVCQESSFIKPNFVVGNAGVGTDAEQARVTSAKQTQVIEKFHKKEYNLLFATKVLEEGINVPSCNVVARFDPIQAYPSYVQSMGRARQREASFYVFIERSDESGKVSTLKQFGDFNSQLADYLRENALHVDDEVDNDDSGLLDDEEIPLELQPYCPGGQLDSPQISAADAISKVHIYCAALKCDRLVTLTPLSWWKKVALNLFQAFVILPNNAVCRDVIEGALMTNKTLAKRAVFLKACKILHQMGELNDQFVPTPREPPPAITGWLDKIEAEGKEDTRPGKAGTNKKTKWYPKKIPEIMRTSIVRPGIKLNIYAIVIKQDKVNEAYEEEAKLYNFEDRKYMFAIATTANLPNMNSFPLLARSGTLIVTLKEITLTNHTSSFTPDEIKQLDESQFVVFAKLVGLNLSSQFLQKTEAPFLIVPVKKSGPQDDLFEIDWEFVSTLNTFNDNSICIPTDAERQRSVDIKSYDDAIVVPWHGNSDPKAKFCVVEVLQDQSPNSDFPESSTKKCKDYVEYYEKNYNVTPYKSTQPLLKCKEIGKQLNFLSPKMDKQKKKKKLGGKTLPRYIPEFCIISPIKASYYLQAKFLPSVLHRVYRLMLAKEVVESVAYYFSWNRAHTDKIDQEYKCALFQADPVVVAHGMLTSRHDAVEALSTKLVGFTLGKALLSYINSVVAGMHKNDLQLRCTISKLEARQRRIDEYQIDSRLHSNSVQKTSNFLDVDAFHYEFEHPLKLSMESLKLFAQDKRKRKSKALGSAFVGHAPPPAKKKLIGISLIELEEIKFQSLDARADFTTESGPSTQTVMEALTLSKANDAFNLERLEVIGDSVLKLFVSLQIYTMNPDWQEGKMTTLRNRLVSNAHLYCFAKKKNLGGILSGSIFTPEYSWLPPGVTCDVSVGKVASMLSSTVSIFGLLPVQQAQQMDEEALLQWAKARILGDKISLRTCPTHSEFGDKSVADAVEALIGAYFLNGGLDSAARLMEWIGLRMPLAEPEPNDETLYCRPAPSKLNFPDTPQNLISQLFVTELENLLCYKFKNQWLLVEAFTHPGFKGNRETGGYQRLEFLGDAILDFLVTNHIYPMVNTPGKLTDLKSALVNNITFGSLCVRYDIHKYLLSSSKDLQDCIDRFVEFQDECGHQVKGHYKLLNDMECLVAEDVEVPKILGDLFESLAGAVYIDSGMSLDIVWKVFYRLMKNEIDIFSKNIPLSPIRELHERIPGIKFIDPSEAVSEHGSGTNSMGWTIMKVEIRKYKLRVYGCGTNKKNAKAAAAKCAIKKLNELEQQQ